MMKSAGMSAFQSERASMRRKLIHRQPAGFGGKEASPDLKYIAITIKKQASYRALESAARKIYLNF